MTEKVEVRLVDSAKIGRFFAENIAFCIPASRLVAVPDLLVEATEKYSVESSISTVVNDPHPFLIDIPSNILRICPLSNTHVPLIKEPYSTNPISFPPFFSVGAGGTPCSRHLYVAAVDSHKNYQQRFLECI